ncbi:hypothetical protein LJB42_002869 [Komagataella kurtzmanii]|nr:hypothetical protein LJB42_002869 [Komagataella kurtzmanii]
MLSGYDEYSSSIIPALETDLVVLRERFSSDQIFSSSISNHPDLTAIYTKHFEDKFTEEDQTSTISFKFAVIENVVLNVLFNVIEKNESTEILVTEILILLDLAIHGCNKQVYKSLPLIIVLQAFAKLDIDIVCDKLGPILLGPHSNERKKILQQNGSLIGKKSPGLVLLSYSQKILNRLFKHIESHELFGGYFRTFIRTSFALDDSLLPTRKWETNVNTKTFLTGLQKQLRQTRGVSSAENKLNRKMQEDFKRFVDLMIFLNDPVPLIEADKRGRNFRHLSDMENSLNFVFEFLKTLIDMDKKQKHGIRLQNQSFFLPETERSDREIAQVVEHYTRKLLQLEIPVTAELFQKQLNDYTFRQLILLQVVVGATYILSLKKKEVDDRIARLRKATKDPKLAQQLHNKMPAVIYDRDLSDACSNLRNTILKHYKEFDSNFYETLQTIAASEESWIDWKLLQYSLAIIETGKFDSYVTLFNEQLPSLYEYAPQYSHKLGTPQLSRIWKIETSLPHLKNHSFDKEEFVEDIRMELYPLDSQLQQPDLDSKHKQEIQGQKDYLNWKSMRFLRSNNEWLKLKQTNEKVGLEGMFDDGLLMDEDFEEEIPSEVKEMMEKIQQEENEKIEKQKKDEADELEQEQTKNEADKLENQESQVAPEEKRDEETTNDVAEKDLPEKLEPSQIDESPVENKSPAIQSPRTASPGSETPKLSHEDTKLQSDDESFTKQPSSTSQADLSNDLEGAQKKRKLSTDSELPTAKKLKP